MPSMTLVVKGDPATNTLGDCPFCHRALLTLSNKGIDFDMEYVDFANKPAYVQELGGKVPILKVPSEDVMMPDSDKIVVWLEDKYPEPSMKATTSVDMGGVFPAFRAFVSGASKETFDAMIAALAPVDKALASCKGPLFGGKAMDAIDAAFAPRLYHIMVMTYTKGYEFPAELSSLWRYMAYVQTLPAWQKVDYGSAKVVEGWSKPH